MSELKPIFVYKKGSLNSTHLKMLKDSGYIPVPLDDISAAKIMIGSLVPMNGSDLLRAALKAMVQSGSGASKSYFVDEMLKILEQPK